MERQDQPLTKEQKRLAKAAKREKQARMTGQLPDSVDVACVIHGRAYDWQYVEKLYNMVNRHLSRPVRFHVWTEHDRSVPPHMIKHILTPWPGIDGPRKSWWYKMQMFNPQYHTGDLLYLDLDMVILNNIDWLIQETTECFWTLRDFRYLQNAHHVAMNSSVMWWNVSNFYHIWDEFCQLDPVTQSRKYPGDQDFLNANIDIARRRLYDTNRVTSYRWQALDGGYDFRVRRHKKPGKGIRLSDDTSILVFHGKPKPHQIQDPLIVQHWQ